MSHVLGESIPPVRAGGLPTERVRHMPGQVIRKLREADAELARGTAIPEVCKALGVADETSSDYPPRHSCASSAVRPSRLPPVPVIRLSASNLRRS